MARILICDPLQKAALEIMSRDHEVIDLPKITREELLEEIPDFHAIVVRARTQVDSEVIDRGKKLRVIARAGVGTDNIDVNSATERGILVVNSPDPSINSVAEHTFTLLLGLCRNLQRSHRQLEKGKWRKDDLIGREMGGKTLGIIGLGRIGTRVASIAKGFGLNLLATDPYASSSYAEKFGAELVDLDRLLSESDFITLHVPLTKSTTGLIGDRELSLMKGDAIIINTSRSEVIKPGALLSHLGSGEIGGAGLDVFDSSDLEKLATFPNVLLTPHIGASTREAQSQIAELIASEVVDALGNRPTRNPVNMPHVDRKSLEMLQPYLRLTDRMVRILNPFIPDHPTVISLSLQGDTGELEQADILLRSSVLGLLSAFHEVNLVNVMKTAERMGIRTEITRGSSGNSYLSCIELVVRTSDGEYSITGALVEADKPRIVELKGYEIEFIPEGNILITEHRDVPGMVGIVGTKLGSAGVNIGTMQLARKKVGEEAMMIILTDKSMPEDLESEIGKIKGMSRVEVISL